MRNEKITNSIRKLFNSLFKKSTLGSLNKNEVQIILELINKRLGKQYRKISDINFSNNEEVVDIAISLVEFMTIEDIAEMLNWVSFEYLTKRVIEKHDFTAKIHHRFKFNGRNYEIDIVATRNKLMVAVDAKHWSARPGKKSQLKKYAIKQAERVEALSRSLSETDSTGTRIIPVIVTLYDERIQFYERIPIVPIYKLDNFLNNIYLYELAEYKVD